MPSARRRSEHNPHTGVVSFRITGKPGNTAISGPSKRHKIIARGKKGRSRAREDLTRDLAPPSVDSGRCREGRLPRTMPSAFSVSTFPVSIPAVLTVTRSLRNHQFGRGRPRAARSMPQGYSPVAKKAAVVGGVLRRGMRAGRSPGSCGRGSGRDGGARSGRGPGKCGCGSGAGRWSAHWAVSWILWE
ncbi:hypothetical protein P7K49_029995 [Saguinus oedipus]|uniref:Uncharacterized protein n=1 Tax=Saguinus oedipus TaxID=9490 RepID=A0ABQ9U8Y2_SAGOE|nr:hypothetical protein P7K49_029995 [Saguinus oedipus]